MFTVIFKLPNLMFWILFFSSFSSDEYQQQDEAPRWSCQIDHESLLCFFEQSCEVSSGSWEELPIVSSCVHFCTLWKCFWPQLRLLRLLLDHLKRKVLILHHPRRGVVWCGVASERHSSGIRRRKKGRERRLSLIKMRFISRVESWSYHGMKFMWTWLVQILKCWTETFELSESCWGFDHVNWILNWRFSIKHRIG